MCSSSVNYVAQKLKSKWFYKLKASYTINQNKFIWTKGTVSSVQVAHLWYILGWSQNLSPVNKSDTLTTKWFKRQIHKKKSTINLSDLFSASVYHSVSAILESCDQQDSLLCAFFLLCYPQQMALQQYWPQLP